MSISKDFLDFSSLYPHTIDVNPMLDMLFPEQVVEVTCPQYLGTDNEFNCLISFCPIKKIEPERIVTKQCMGGKFKVTWTKFILYKGLVK